MLLKKEYLLVAVFSTIFILAVGSSTFIVSYIFLATSREAEYLIIRQEFSSLVEGQARDKELEINRLREHLNRQEFTNQKRYELMRDEIELIKKQIRQQKQ